MIQFKEIKQTPKESALAAYWFVCEDLKDGLEYGFSSELYDKCMEAIGSDKRAGDRELSSRIFAEEFYAECKRLKI